jgi:hypothetical protein
MAMEAKTDARVRIDGFMMAVSKVENVKLSDRIFSRLWGVL